MRLSGVLFVGMGLCLLAFMAGVIMDEFGILPPGQQTANVLVVLWMLLFVVAAAAGCAWIAERTRSRRLGLAGLLVTIPLSAVSLLHILLHEHSIAGTRAILPTVIAAGWSFIGFVFIASFLNALEAKRRWERHARNLAVVVVGMLACYIVVAVAAAEILGPLSYIDRRIRLRIGFILTVVGGALAIGPIAAHTWRLIDRGEVVNRQRRPVELRCPRCGTSQTLQTEGDQCHACGLRIRLSVQT